VALTSPIHVGDAGGHPLRMFASPVWLATRKRDMPWHSTEDLLSALGVPAELSEHMRRMTKRDWLDDTRTVATADGIVTIAPHAMAEGMIDAVRHRGAEAGSRAVPELRDGGPQGDARRPAARGEAPVRAGGHGWLIRRAGRSRRGSRNG
jgi:hypothetical protein